ncbi:MAG TPA: hypothetical protein PKD29_05095, partial [Rhodocyclaceae bacterium]|nr:hypothetical protein [Rhodocyclaceae bacterium]
VQATGGSGTARVTAPAGQAITTAFLDVNTGAAATGNAEITAVGDQAIHTTNGLAAGTGSLRVAAFGTGTTRVETGGHQLLELDYPEFMQAARDGRLTIGNTAALGNALVKGRSQDIFAKSITLQGGSGAGSDAKLDATTTQNISTLKGGISVTGGAGGKASLDPTDQVIVTGGPIDVTGGSGAGVTGEITSGGTQVILSTLGDITITGGTALNAFGMITTTGAVSTIATVGDIVLTAGTAGMNADAVITSGSRVVDFACGLGATPTCSPVDLAGDPFGNLVSESGILSHGRPKPITGVTSSGGPDEPPVTYPPVDPVNLILAGGGDEDKRGGLLPPEEEEPRLRIGRPLGVCR